MFPECHSCALQFPPVVTSGNAKAGMAVERGPDWRHGDSVDGGAGNVGVLVQGISSQWLVKWAKTGKQQYHESSDRSGRRELVVRGSARTMHA